MKAIAPDVVDVTAITPSIYQAEDVFKIAQGVAPKAIRVLGGVHATFMYKQVLSEVPWVDVIVRSEGEEICTNLMQAIADGRFPADRHKIQGLAFKDGDKIVATPATSTVKDLSKIKPDWSVLEWSNTSTSRSARASPSPISPAAAP